jgi:toxin ParE1/3/4
LIIAWLQRAKADFSLQVAYIANENPKAALQQGDLVLDTMERLASYPELGRVGRVGETRELVVAGTKFVVVYRIRVQQARLEILRILHGAQQWPPTDES